MVRRKTKKNTPRAQRIMDAALQYSKKLSRLVSWCWVAYRFAALVAMCYVPEAAEHIVDTISGVDTIMMTNLGTYLVSSTGEKLIYSDQFVSSWLEKHGLKSETQG